MTPLSLDRQSALPGEGSAFFLLSRDKGDSLKHVSIIDISIGNLVNEDVPFPRDAVFFLGADGHKCCDRLYADCISWGTEAACYSPLYGSLPIGPAFDMAIAALSIKEGKIFASPESVADQENYSIIKRNSPIASRSISCLKLGKEGELGMITLAPGS